MTDVSTCSICGAPDGRGGHVLIPVVDDHGSTERCGLCVIPLLAQVRASGDVTVFVARPQVATR